LILYIQEIIARSFRRSAPRLASASVLVILLASAAPGLAEAPGLFEEKIDSRLARRLEKSGAPVALWVFLADKPGERSEPVSPRALERRRRVGFRSGGEDAPIHPAYAEGVAAAGARIRTRSKWLNALAVTADRESIRRIAALPYVVRIREVASLAAPPPAPSPERKEGARPRDVGLGLSGVQLRQINVTPLLEAGFAGEGVHILMLDAGAYTEAPCFASMEIEARRDFVDGDAVVEGLFYENHGTQTLSVIGGYAPGWIVGPAHGATYSIARTEDTSSETPAEEDHWVAAIEWGESLGVDLASSSLGYNIFDFPYAPYTYDDLDGETAPISIAAAAAVERGMVVVNSGGNEGNDPWHYIIPPADARGLLAIGAVTINGDHANFSSYGPTADGRIKPDLAGLGSGVAGVGPPRETDPASLYTENLSGTSYSAPLVAGACALLLQVHPILTPERLASALRATASRSDDPNNELGWGIVNAYQAALRPVVFHDPATDAAWNGEDAFAIEIEVSLYPGFDPPAIVSGGADAFTDTLPLAGEGGYAYSAEIPSASVGDAKRYYFLFTRHDTTYTVPEGAPAAYYEIGDATPPSIVHAPIGPYPLQAWPAEVVAVIRDADEVDEDSVYVDYQIGAPDAKQGTFPDGLFSLARRNDSTFAGAFPSIGLTNGASILYRIHACDASGNCAVAPEGSTYSATLYSVTHALLYGTEGDEGPTNPFVSGAAGDYRILFDLPARETVHIRIYDAAGRLLRDVTRDEMGPGARLEALWDGKDASGRRVDSGVYFLRFEAGPYAATRKLVVIR
jgi:hypothetical protein